MRDADHLLQHIPATDSTSAEKAAFELVDRGLQPKSVTSTLACFINPARVELLSQGLMQDDCLIRSYTHFHVLVDNHSCR